MGILGVDRVIFDGDNNKVLGVPAELGRVTFRKSKASENLGVFKARLGVYSRLHFGLLWGEHRWRHLYA